MLCFYNTRYERNLRANFVICHPSMLCLVQRKQFSKTTLLLPRLLSPSTDHCYSKNPFFPSYSQHDTQLSHLLRCLSEWRLQDARQVFDKMPQRNVVYWTSTVSKFARNGCVEEARILFDIMPERNLITWNAMLTAYVRSGRISDAYQLFDRMPEQNVVSWTSMISGFARFGRIDDARSLFYAMPDRNLVSWNSMIAGLVRNGEFEEARQLFNEMPERDQVSWNTMISGYAEFSRMEEARCLFDKCPEANVFAWTSLIAGYCRIGEVDEARYLFEKMPTRNVVSWTVMIGGYVWNQFHREAILLFLEMKQANEKPNQFTFVSLVFACAGLGFPYVGKQTHAQLVLNGFNVGDERVSKSLISMYSRMGIMDYANHVFCECSTNNIVAWNSLINGYVGIGSVEKARQLFDLMPVRDSVSWTSMISGYFRSNEVAAACSLFNKMPAKDAVAWTAVISGLVQNELFSKAIDGFSQMRIAGFKPLDFTYSTILSVVGTMAYLELGKQLHARLLQTRLEFEIVLDNSLVSMYAKCGEIDDANRIFCSMTFRDVISWNSMTIGFSHHGFAKKALELFETMRATGFEPNSVTFLGILSACSHTGLSDQAWKFFNSMTEEHLLKPQEEHYICMIDLLGRAGKVDEAYEFVQKLPFEPGLAVWGALLGLCSLPNLNASLAKHAAEHVLELDPSNVPAHVLLCNIYAATTQHSEEAKLRKEMGSKGLRKYPGCSWVLLNGRVHVFLSGDKSHPETNKIYEIIVGVQEYWSI